MTITREFHNCSHKQGLGQLFTPLPKGQVDTNTQTVLAYQMKKNRQTTTIVHIKTAKATPTFV